MYQFFATIHARPASARAGGDVELPWGRFPTLDVALAAAFPLSFETAVENLRELERLFVEPDGAFVWVAAAEPGTRPEWQVDGVLYDREGRLVYVEAKGRCPAAEFDRLLAALSWPETPLAIQLQREAVILDEPTFRRYAQANAGSG